MIGNKKIAFVLSGGSAYGFAHVGFLKHMKELGIEPDIIAGTSAGALIGGAYASGMEVEEIEKSVLEFERGKIIDLKFVPFIGDSVLVSKKVDVLLQSVFQNKLIQNSNIKFVATAVDIDKGKIKYFKRGLYWEAIRASISIPGLFTPYKIGEARYIDGGIMDNLPTTIAHNMGADIVIAVNVIDYSNAIIEAKTGVHSLINALTLAQKEITRLKTQADLIINLKIKDVSMFGFRKKESMLAINQGYTQTKKKAKEIKALFNFEQDANK